MRLHQEAIVRTVSTALLGVWVAACGGDREAPAAAEVEQPTSTAVTGALLERGATVYKANCIPCHGPLGKGDGPSSFSLNPKPRDHTNREYMDGVSDEQIAATVVQGGAPRGYPNMPSHPHIKGEDLVGLVAHVRTLSRGVEDVEKVDVAAK
jgi:mono/diheme cytochrome c family protein